MSRRLNHAIAASALVVAGVVGAGPAPLVAHAADSGECATSSWTAGETLVCAGSLVYRDYVYDDYGANTGTPGAASTGSLSNPTGDVRYPVGAESTADLVRLDLTVAGDHLHAVFELDALYQPDSTIAAVAIDTDGDPNTGGGTWPGLSVTSAGWDTFASFSTGDPDTNTITGDIPLPADSFGNWRVQAVTAQADGTVMNVAFRGTQELGNWWEDTQASALQKGDISPFGVAVTAAPTGFTSAPANVLGGGNTYERVYTSAYTLGTGEGMTYDGIAPGGGPGPKPAGFNQIFHFVGKYQPYGLYVPPGDGPHGLQLVMHGHSANHASLMRQAGMKANVGDALDRVLVNPLGRGPAGWYSSYSERDVLDALADVEATFPIDHDREFSGGYSMGGYGTFRFAELFPDRFAGFTAWVGFTGDCFNGTPLAGHCPTGAVGNVINYVGNLNNVPGSMMYSGADELVWATSAIGMGDAFAATGNQYAWYFHPVAEHLTYALVDDWRKETQYTASLRRPAHVPHVHFTTDPLVDAPSLGIVHDRAYWVRDLRTTGGAGTVDLTTSGCGGSIPVTLEVQNAGVDPLPWVSREGRLRGEQQVIAANAVEGTLTAVSSLTIDTASACLDGGSVTYSFTTDGPATITLSDSRVITLPAAGTYSGTV
jgi:pimeloyl-ACP methyl ester carboxylesterase